MRRLFSLVFLFCLSLAACSQRTIGPADQCTRVPELEVVPDSIEIPGDDTVEFRAVQSVEPPGIRAIWWESSHPSVIPIVDSAETWVKVWGKMSNKTGETPVITATAMLPPGCPGSVVTISDSAVATVGIFKGPSLEVGF